MARFLLKKDVNQLGKIKGIVFRVLSRVLKVSNLITNGTAVKSPKEPGVLGGIKRLGGWKFNAKTQIPKSL